MTVQEVLLYFLKCEIIEYDYNENTLDVSEEVIKNAFLLAKKHSVAHIFAEGVRKSGMKISDELLTELKNSVILNYTSCFRKNVALEKIKKTLSEERVRFIPLKGSVIKDYYPGKWLRNSCDIDILIEEQNIEKAVEVLCEQLHYVFDKKASHDVSLYCGNVHLELHFQLVEEGLANKASKVLKDVWKLSYPNQKNEYEYIMPDDLFYFYHIAHMAMHFKGAGCGIRNFLDLWVLNHKIDYDLEKRNSLLKNGELYKFALESEKLSEVWFSDHIHTDLSKSIEEYVFKSGVYGSRKNRVAIERSENDNGIVYWLLRVFQPYVVMKYNFPVLNKHPYLLPLMWVKRWNRILFSKQGKDNIKSEMYENKTFEKEYSKRVNKMLTDLKLL